LTKKALYRLKTDSQIQYILNNLIYGTKTLGHFCTTMTRPSPGGTVRVNHMVSG